MVAGLIEGKPLGEMLAMARGSLKNKRDDLAASLDGDLSPRHLFVLRQLHEHVTALERQLAQIDAELFQAMTPYHWAWVLPVSYTHLDVYKRQKPLLSKSPAARLHEAVLSAGVVVML